MKKTLIALTLSMSMLAVTAIPTYAEPTQETQAEIQHSEGYDTEHPLAGKIDEWDLRLPTKYLGVSEVSSSNIQAMLTGQMDQYYAAPIGESINPVTGTKGYVTEVDYTNTRKVENDLYSWYCNWLNGMDFENMSEMERAKEIQKVLGSASYVEGTAGNYDYGVLIDKKGQCTDFAMTARSLATALGLENAVSGYGIHSVYYIWIDGKQYMGSNQYLNLDYPSSLQ